MSAHVSQRRIRTVRHDHMTDIERYIVDQIQAAEYLDDDVKSQWIEKIKTEGLTPLTTRMLLQSMLDHALAKIGSSIDPSDPETQKQYQRILAEIDHAEEE